jgi:methyl-accepting chemotaxis protein
MMSDSDKTTIKLPAHPDKVKGIVRMSNLTPEQEKALELANQKARLEEENKKVLEYIKTIEQLRESLKQEQAKATEMAEKAVSMEFKLNELAELEAKVKNVAELEARVKELSEVIGKISGIASTGKAP